MAAPAFLRCFPVYCPHIPAPVSEKQEDTFPHVAAEEAKQCYRASKKKTRLQDIKKTRISSHKRNFRLAIPYNGITKKEKQ